MAPTNRLRTAVRRCRRAVSRRLPGAGTSADDSGRAVADGGTVTATDEGSSLFSRDFLESLPFWLPPTLLMGFFVYGAIGWNAIISLTDWTSFGTPSYGSLDLSQYQQLWSDPAFWTAAQNTVVLLLAFTVACLIIGLGLAILIDQGIRFENAFRTIYLLPMSLSFVVTAKFWSWMYNSQYGVINATLRGVGLDFLTAEWLADPSIVLGAVIFALLWQFSGYAMVVYLAGLRAIPSEHFEAARVDGATTLRMYWRVVIPQLRSSTISAAVVLMVFALKAFDFLFVMFGKYPGPGADILAVMMYRQAFSSLQWAYASAVAMTLFVMALVIVGPYLYWEYRRGEL
jgi:glucose/mannose transport system permease protein